MSKEFVHLHTHSHYSLLDGLSKIEGLVGRAHELGLPAQAITDHGNMHGAIEFYKECKDTGIKPIIGVEAYMAARTRHDKETGIDGERTHLTLLAKNATGYKNLMKLVSLSFLEGYYYKPRMDLEILAKHAEGVICLSGCPGSKFIKHLKNRNRAEAEQLLGTYVDIFGKENVFVEAMKHDEVEWYGPLIDDIVSIGKQYELPLVGTWDSHYLHEDDRDAHNTLLAINTQNQNFKFSGNYSLIDANQAEDIFRHIPNATKNTLKVAEMVDIELELGKWTFPTFPTSGEKTYDDMLREKAYEGLKLRNMEATEEVLTRVNYELEVIKKKGYSVYFLVVSDLLNFAKENGILSTTRGSAGGCLVSYLTFITTVNPLEYNLPFERFLNPERPSAPDIDMDFADNRRDEVIEYAKRKYGEHAVAQIGTFGTMMAKGAIRDVARALGHPYEIGDKISKMIPLGSQGFPMTIDRAFAMVPELKDLYDKDRTSKEIIDMAKKIEGSVRHVSVHAAGVVIAPTRVDDFSPVQLDPKGGKIITQYDMHAVEAAGLTKFDFLGIRNLSIIADAIERIKKIRGIDIDITQIPIDDKKTFALLANGQTEALFQLNGGGMTKFLVDLKPTSIHDINAMVALYRPGPMEMIPEYIKRKHNPKLVRFLDPRMEPILARSNGILVYQDDVMMIAIELAGYSWLDADKLRKAMGKKIPEVMNAEKAKLVEGLLKHGMKQSVVDELWKLIEPFAAYGFNKAHAASYGLVAYQTAYLKANYPAEYMTACMTAESGDLEVVAIYMEECKKLGFTILPPDVNESFSDYTIVVNEGVVTNNIRFGLKNVKNFGEEIGKAIIAERKIRGKFTSIEDFLERVTHKNLNKKSLEALIMCGALDQFGERNLLLQNIEALLAFHKGLGQFREQSTSLFDGLDSKPKAKLILSDAPAATLQQKLAWEKELLELYISGHPLDPHIDKIEKAGNTIKSLQESGECSGKILVAAVNDVRVLYTKKNERMAFVKLHDKTGQMEGVVFPNSFKELGSLFEPGKILAIRCNLTKRNDEMSLIIDQAKELIDNQ